ATVIVDEAAMVPTPRLAELATLADRKGWRVVLVGDPMQFSAVGRGGMFAHLVETCGAIELDRVRRFANAWERDASLRLRQGDVSVVELYDAHGRLHDGTTRRMEADVVNAWWHAHQQGESAAMMAATNETVAALNRRAQLLRAGAGEIDLDGPCLVSGDRHIHVGDQVATRRNDRQLRTDRGAMVRNRDLWEVKTIASDGSISVGGRSGTVTLPPEYAQAHVELAYAQTSHAAQGRTVDRSLVLVDGSTDARGIYVPMTRGRLSNEAFVVTEANPSAADVLAEALARHWVDRPAVSRRAELQAGHDVYAPRDHLVPLDGTALRRLLEADHALDHAMSRSRWVVEQAGRDPRAAIGRREELLKSIADARARLDRANERVIELDRPLRRRRHRPELDRWNQVARSAGEGIKAGRTELSELAETIPALESDLGEAQLTSQRRQPGLEAEHLAIQARLHADRAVRGRRLGLDPPDYLVDVLGPRPHGGAGAARWDEASALVDEHRSAFGITDTNSLLGSGPGYRDTAYATSCRIATAACEQLGRDLGRDLELEPPSLGHGLSL
ncbi:MAG: ATP-dependent DNA helicase, partial [Acidimicrobiales bacterium]